jgi:hypothetical protein
MNLLLLLLLFFFFFLKKYYFITERDAVSGCVFDDVGDQEVLFLELWVCLGDTPFLGKGEKRGEVDAPEHSADRPLVKNSRHFLLFRFVVKTFFSQKSNHQNMSWNAENTGNIENQMMRELIEPGLALLYERFLSSFPRSMFESCPEGRCPDGVCELSTKADRPCGRCSGLVPWLADQRVDNDRSHLVFENICCSDLFDPERGPLALFKLNAGYLGPDSSKGLSKLVDFAFPHLLTGFQALTVFIEAFRNYKMEQVETMRAWLALHTDVLDRCPPGEGVDPGAAQERLVTIIGLMGCEVFQRASPSAKEMIRNLLPAIGCSSLSIWDMIPEEHHTHPDLLVALARFRVVRGSLEGVDQARENLLIKRMYLPKGDLGVARAIHGLFIFIAALLPDVPGFGDEAISLAREELQLREAVQPLGHLDVFNCTMGLAMALYMCKQLPESERVMKGAVQAGREMLPEVHEKMSDCVRLLASVVHEQGRGEEAEQILAEAQALGMMVATSREPVAPSPPRPTSKTVPMPGSKDQGRGAGPAPAKPAPPAPSRPAISDKERERLERELLEDEDGDDEKGKRGKGKKGKAGNKK